MVKESQDQIPLRLSWEPAYTLENFYLHRGNELAFHAACKVLSGELQNVPSVVFVGPEGVGKTHLLKGIFHASLRLGSKPSAVYLGGAENLPEPEEIAPLKLLLVDNLPSFAHPEDHLRLLAAYDSLHRSGGRILLASRFLPRDLKGFAGDLKSRLQWGMVVEIQDPDEAGVREILSKLAQDRRIGLDEGVVDFLLSRLDRSIPALIRALDRIDHYSLAGKRLITIPMTKQALGV
jgi:DnaA family protein